MVFICLGGVPVTLTHQSCSCPFLRGGSGYSSPSWAACWAELSRPWAGDPELGGKCSSGHRNTTLPLESHWPLVAHRQLTDGSIISSGPAGSLHQLALTLRLYPDWQGPCPWLCPGGTGESIQILLYSVDLLSLLAVVDPFPPSVCSQGTPETIL